MVDPWIAVHDRDGTNYQAVWDQFRPQGFRPVSGSVYGPRSNPLYAAVFVNRAGPDFAAIHGADTGAFETWFQNLAPGGWSPRVFSVAGPANDPVFLCVMEQVGWTSLTRYGLVDGPVSDPGTIQHWLDQAYTNNWILRCASVYGTSTSPRYAIVCDPNDERLLWAWAGPETAGAYQSRFDAQVQQFARPDFVTVGPAGWMSVFREDDIGAWQAHHDMDSAGYQMTFDQRVGEGLVPVMVQAGNTDQGPRFAALFATDNRPVTRQLTVTGPGSTVFDPVDNAVIGNLHATGVRAAQVAVVRNGRLVHSRAYTWGEPAYPVTVPESVFRIASLTKPITSLCVFSLIDAGLLGLDDLVMPLLGLTAPAGRSITAKAADITVRHLLAHTSGLNDIVDAYAVAVGEGVTLPIDERAMASWLLSEPLHADPGVEKRYANAGFLLLGLVIEAITGQAYGDAVAGRVFQPLGLTRPTLIRAHRFEQPPGAVRQHFGFGPEADLQIGPSESDEWALRLPWGPIIRLGRPTEPLPYGGEAYGIFDAFGGWVLAASDYAKILAAFDRSPYPLLTAASETTMVAPDPTSTAAGFGWLSGYALGWNTFPIPGTGEETISHGGNMPGVKTYGMHSSDGWAFVMFQNGDDTMLGGIVENALRAIPLANWPVNDLFTNVGIPTF